MSLTFSEFDSYKLITEFSDDCYTHTIPCDPGVSSSTGGRLKTEKWSRVGRVGRGAFGTVWKERCAQNGAVRAVKQIHELHIKDTGEMLALTKMNSYSQYFVQFFGWFRDKEHIYLAMEYIECGDLQKLILEEDLSEGDVKSVTRQLLEGLKILHENNFCHRDLKPQNILIVKWIPITVKISDFGIAKQVGDKTELRTFAGSPGYTAPEVWGYLDSNTSIYTNAVDIWSLGSLIYAMITKETPFPGARELLDYIETKTPFPEMKLKDKSSTATEFIASLMKPLPQERLTAQQAQKHLWLDVEQGDEQTFWTELPNTVAPAKPKSRQNRITQNTITVVESKPKQYPATSAVVVTTEPKIEEVPITPKAKLGQALITAVMNGHTAIVQLMLKRGADIMAKDSNEFTPVHWAACRGHLGMLQLLVERGAGTMPIAANGDTPLILAAQNGHTEVARFLLGEGADIETRDPNGFRPAHCAAQNGHLEVLQFLVERGVDIMPITANKATPLSLAAQNGHTEVARFLLGEGADIETRDFNGFRPAHCAAQNGHLEVLQLLVERGVDIMPITANKATPLSLAAEKGHTEVARFLLEKGADIEAKNSGEFTPVHWAAQEGHLELLQLLVERGADIMPIAANKATPLSLAAWNGHTEVARFLLEKGADIEARGSSEFRPVHFAAQKGHLEVLQLLVERGADIMPIAANKATPLILVAQNGHIEVARFLLEKGADIEARGPSEFRPVHWAAREGHLEVLQLLVERGADIMPIAADKATPLSLAAGNGHAEVVRFLLENDADTMAENTYQPTPLNQATDSGHTETKGKISLPETQDNEDTLVAVIGKPVGEEGSIAERVEGPIVRVEEENIIGHVSSEEGSSTAIVQAVPIVERMEGPIVRVEEEYTIGERGHVASEERFAFMEQEIPIAGSAEVIVDSQKLPAMPQNHPPLKEKRSFRKMFRELKERMVS